MSQPPATMELSYESAPPIGPRPRWVWIVVTIYLLLFLGTLALPFILIVAEDLDVDAMSIGSVSATVIALCGMALLFTPVRITRRRPITRRGIWIPLIASGFLVCCLVTAAGWAIIEFAKANDAWASGMMWGGGFVWIVWTIIIWLMTSRVPPEWLAMRLHRMLFAGSVAELLVAVPTHIFVRRRHECCAGYLTASAIVIGCVVMFVSIGPSVAMLYYRRWQQTTGQT